MAVGSDNRLYISNGAYTRIYVVSLSGGTDSIFYSTSAAYDLIAGADGNIWFTRAGKIVKMTPSGTSTAYDVPTGVKPNKLVGSPDGTVWFLDGHPSDPQQIGRITTTGIVTTYPSLDASTYSISGPVVGPDGAIWFGYTVRLYMTGVPGVGRLGE